jgi:hypothetical protein
MELLLLSILPLFYVDKCGQKYFTWTKTGFPARKSGKKCSRSNDQEHFIFISARIPYFWDSSTATATETVIPTMGLLPAFQKPSEAPKGLPKVEKSLRDCNFYKQSKSLLCSLFLSIYGSS